MPYANEHAARLKDPGQYDRFRRENDKFGSGIHAIWGIKGGKVELQTIRFDASKFTVDQAKAWLKAHDYKPILFEPATGGKKSEEPMETRTVQMPPLSIRADIGPRSINEADRTVELIFSTGAGVKRYEFLTGKTYVETLSLEPEHVRLDRLNDGAPLLDSHSAISVADQLGAVVPGSVQLFRKAATARVRFSKRQDVDPIWQDVRDGIIRNVSIGYRVYKFEESTGKGGENALPVRKAIDWEPFEISMVPIGADAGAKARGSERADTNACEVVPAAAQVTVEVKVDEAKLREAITVKEKTMGNETRSDTIVEPDPLKGAVPTPPPPPAEPSERERGIAAERARVDGIRLACLAGKMTRDFEDGLIKEGVSLEAAQGRVLEEIHKRDAGGPAPTSRPPAEVVGTDPFVHVREGIENALLHRCWPEREERLPSGEPRKVGFALSDKGRQYRGMSLFDIAKAFVGNRYGRTTGYSRMELAGLALGLDIRAGMHTTSDFPLLLADVANKLLLAGYREAPQKFQPLVRRIPLVDFKATKLLQLGDAPALLEVLEHGEVKSGTIGESKEEILLATYARKFGLTRKALVNDDLNAFAQVPAKMGRQARKLESDLVWAQITANAAMGDGVTLFHANHGNLAGSGGAIGVDTIGAARTAMRLQKGIDGVTLIEAEPRYLVVPVTLETLADQFVSVNLLASQASAVNPFAGKLAVIAEPRLDSNSLTAWYIAASPDQVEMIVVATLEGEEGPRIESRIGWDIEGVEMKITHDYGAKVADYRGFYKNPGA